MSPMLWWLYNRIEFFIVGEVIQFNSAQFFTEEGNWVLFLTKYFAYANAWSVAHKFKHLGEIKKSHDRSFSHSLFFLNALAMAKEH